MKLLILILLPISLFGQIQIIQTGKIDNIQTKGIENLNKTNPNSVYDSITQVILNRFTSNPPVSYKVALDNFIKKVAVRNHVWDSLEIFTLDGSFDRQSSRVNLIQNSYNLTDVGTISFIAGKGSQAGIDETYQTYAWIPSTNAVKFKLNSCSFGYYVTEGLETTTGNYVMGGSNAATGYTNFFSRINGTSGRVHLCQTNRVYTSALDTGFFATRYQSNSTRVFFSTSTQDFSGALTALPTTSPYLFASNNGANSTFEGSQRVFASWWGASLSNAQTDTLRTALIKLYNDIKNINYTYNQNLVNKKLAVYRNGEQLWIGVIIKDTLDGVFEFQKCMANNLVTFKYVNVNNSIDSIVNYNLKKTADFSLFDGTSSDAIGPYQLETYGFIGGNHLYSGNPSARNVSYQYYIGSDTLINDWYYVDSVRIVVRNEILDPATSLADVLLQEDVTYVVRANNIEVNMSITPKKDATVLNYFGMQFGQVAFDSIYFAGGDTTNIQLKGNSKDSGPYSTNRCERFVAMKAAKTICMSMWMDSTGMGGNRWLDASDPTYHLEVGKIYDNLIGKTKVLDSDTVYRWSGTYTFFSNLSDNFLAYEAKKHGNNYVIIDAHRAGSDTITVSSFTTLTQVKKVGNITVTRINSTQISISNSSGYGYYIGKLE